jgi:hypothetical protein
MRHSLGFTLVVCALAMAGPALSQVVGAGPAATSAPNPQSGANASGQVLRETSPGDLRNLIFQSSGGAQTAGIWSSNSSILDGVSERISAADDPPDAAADASAGAPVGSTMLTFTSVPKLAVDGGFVADLTRPGAIPSGTTISGAATSTTVTLSESVASPGVSSGDHIVFYGPKYLSNRNLRVSYLIDAGSRKVGVTGLDICDATTSYSKCQTYNAIALSTARRSSHVQLNAAEFDIETADNTNTYDSLAGLLVNIFNAKGGTVLQTGAVGGGDWNLGVKLSGMAPAGIGVVGGATERFGSLIDTQNGSFGYATGAVMLGNYGSGVGAGSGQFVGFRGPTCCSAQSELYQDGANSFHVDNLSGGVTLTPAKDYPVSIGPFLRTMPVTLASLTGSYDGVRIQRYGVRRRLRSVSGRLS